MKAIDIFQWLEESETRPDLMELIQAAIKASRVQSIPGGPQHLNRADMALALCLNTAVVSTTLLPNREDRDRFYELIDQALYNLRELEVTNPKARSIASHVHLAGGLA